MTSIDHIKYSDSVIPGYINILQSHLQKKSNYLEEFGDLYPFIIHINRVKDFEMIYANQTIEGQLQVTQNDAIKYGLRLWRELYKEQSFKFVQKFTRDNIQNLSKGKTIKYIQILKPQNSDQYCEMITFRTLLNQSEYLSISMTIVPGVESISNEQNLILPNVKFQISKRELEILKLVLKGMTSAKVAKRLFISKHTVDTHRRNIIKKLGANSLLQAYKILQEKNLFQSDEFPNW